MNTILDIFAAALNSLWQAALAAALVWAGLRWLRPRFNAATRYVIWWAALAIVLILPAGPRALSWWQARGHVAIAPDTRAAVRSVPLNPTPLEAPVVVTVRPDRHPTWPYWILGIWAALCLYKLSQIVRSYFYLRGVKHRASLAPQSLPPIARKASLLVSGAVASPMAVGFAHPAVVLPQALAEEITPQELDHVLLHEAAHLARRDDWANLAARVLGAALVLHPVAWFILREIERERESACDDWVVARTGEARPYAASLARMFELRSARARGASGEALAAGIFGGGSRTAERIELLLQRGRDFSARASRARLAAGVMALLGVIAAASFAPCWIAFAQQRPAFEVASVRLASPTSPTGVPVRRFTAGGLSYGNVTLSEYVELAYNLKPYQIVQPHPPAMDEHYDIEARASGPASPQQIKLMLQTLLEERFKLRFHRDIRETPVYALTIAKNRPRLAPAGAEAAGRDIKISPDGIEWRNTTLDYLAGWISNLPSLGRPVIDRTSLAGGYDFTLRIDGLMNSDSGKRGLAAAVDASIFSAIQDLGLKMEAEKAPLEFMTIDHAEKPDAN